MLPVHHPSSTSNNATNTTATTTATTIVITPLDYRYMEVSFSPQHKITCTLLLL
jgi:hypothetical protein